MNYEITGHDITFCIMFALFMVVLIFSLFPKWLQKKFRPIIIQATALIIFFFAIYFLCIGMEIIPTIVIIKNIAAFVALASLVVAYSLKQTGSDPAYLRMSRYRFSKKIPS